MHVYILAVIIALLNASDGHAAFYCPQDHVPPRSFVDRPYRHEHQGGRIIEQPMPWSQVKSVCGRLVGHFGNENLLVHGCAYPQFPNCVIIYGQECGPEIRDHEIAHCNRWTH